MEELARRAGWDLQHEMIPEDAGEVKIECLEGFDHKHLVKRRPKKKEKLAQDVLIV